MLNVIAIITLVLWVFVVKKNITTGYTERTGGMGLKYFVPLVFSLCVFVVKKNHHGAHGGHGDSMELLYFVSFVCSSPPACRRICAFTRKPR